MHSSYEILRHKPGRKKYSRVYWKVYYQGVFQQTFDKLKDAQAWVDKR